MRRWLLAWLGAAVVATLIAFIGFTLSALVPIRWNVDAAGPWWGILLPWLAVYPVFGLPVALVLAGAVTGVRSMLGIRRPVTTREAVLVGAGIGVAINPVISLAIFAGRFALFPLPTCIVASAAGGATFASLFRRS